MCANDPVAFFDGFAFTYDPRRDPSTIPFILYPFQERAVRMIDDSIGSHDLCISKSRDMGASWCLLGVFLWRWLFRPGQSFLLVSRNEDYVDKTGNPKSLFWKLDFLIRYLPSWMMPRFERARLRLTNLDNMSMIDGESTTGDVARGDRRTAIALDEFAAFDVDSGYRAMASTRDATRSRIFNSTPSGTSNAFAEVASSSTIAQLRMHWSDHPGKSQGMYTLDGKVRSPWYDNECARCLSPAEIAQELDIDFRGSQAVFFEPAKISELAYKCWSPDLQGELESTQIGTDPVFNSVRNGAFRLWFRPTPDGYPPPSTYAIGADISSGTGSSNSCLSVLDLRTGTKVAEWVSSTTRPEQMAVMAVAACRWFCNEGGAPAMLIHEAAGPGRIMGDACVDLGFRNFWMRVSEGYSSVRYTQKIGWFPTRESKVAMWGQYRRLLYDGAYVNPSKESIEEAGELVYTNGGIEHIRSTRSIDPSGARMNHGDRATADALSALALAPRIATQAQLSAKPAQLDPRSMAHRRSVSTQREAGIPW